jgi:hypothetical protein
MNANAANLVCILCIRGQSKPCKKRKSSSTTSTMLIMLILLSTYTSRERYVYSLVLPFLYISILKVQIQQTTLEGNDIYPSFYTTH